ncbi:unnamed protein product [Nesidiocoris tenuis]|uniref:Uncharacterized protein n=1 Tax=Nesidiocoris tenuis TaxID=355587 RepID=A0A6H5GU43_9HEMI|nr:unnamed protein product [Nesidiocoris tenuis]
MFPFRSNLYTHVYMSANRTGQWKIDRSIFTGFPQIIMDSGRNSSAGAGPSPVARSLMESLLLAKMERAGFCPPTLVRMDSTDSASSFASGSSLGSEVCRCDDCLLGIADLHISPQGSRKKEHARDNFGYRWQRHRLERRLTLLLVHYFWKPLQGPFFIARQCRGIRS